MIANFLRLASGPIPRRWCLALVLVAAAGGGLARAEDVDAIVGRGIELRRQGHDVEALAEFQRAMKISKAPRTQAQQALAEQALGLWTDAEYDLAQALAHVDDSWIKKNRATLGKALSKIQTHLGTLEIWGTPAGASIFVNDKPMGALPLEKAIRVSGESVVLRAHADGHMDATRTLRVPAGETVREHVELISVPAAPLVERSRNEPVVAVAVESPVAATGEPRGGRPGPPSESPSAQQPVRDQPLEASSSSSKLRPWAWVLAAGAVGGLALGAVETFVSIDKKNAFDNHTSPDPADSSRTIKDCGTAALSAACKPLQEQYDRSVTLEIVGYAVGGALAVGSALLFVLSSPDSDRRGDRQGMAFGCLPEPSTRGLSCALRF